MDCVVEIWKPNCAYEGNVQGRGGGGGGVQRIQNFHIYIVYMQNLRLCVRVFKSN